MDRLDTYPSLDVALANANSAKAQKKPPPTRFLTIWLARNGVTVMPLQQKAAFGPREAVRRQLTFDFDATDDAPLCRAMRKSTSGPTDRAGN